MASCGSHKRSKGVKNPSWNGPAKTKRKPRTIHSKVFNTRPGVYGKL